MERNYFLLILLFLTFSIKAQTPCQLSLDSIYLDNAYSNCNHLYFKYNVSGGNASSYYWTYGDGNSCGCYKPKNFYTKNGNYQVCGKIQDANGCKDSLCITVNVNCTNPCDLSEIGIYSFDTVSYNCNEYEFVSFISPNAKRIVWEFGDGDSSNSLYALHTYHTNGKYTVRLIAQDSLSCGDTAILEVNIDCEQKLPCNFNINAIDTSSTSDCKQKSFVLKSNHQPKEVTWNFGDGLTLKSNGTVQHQFKDTGIYEICAIAIDSFDCSDTLCIDIVVSCPKSSAINLFGKTSFQIFPLPFHAILQIGNAENGSICLYDQRFSKVFESVCINGLNEYNLSYLESGFYYLAVQTNETVEYFKILKE